MWFNTHTCIDEVFPRSLNPNLVWSNCEKWYIMWYETKADTPCGFSSGWKMHKYLAMSCEGVHTWGYHRWSEAKEHIRVRVQHLNWYLKKNLFISQVFIIARCTKLPSTQLALEIRIYRTVQRTPLGLSPGSRLRVHPHHLREWFWKPFPCHLFAYSWR